MHPLRQPPVANSRMNATSHTTSRAAAQPDGSPGAQPHAVRFGSFVQISYT